MSELSVWLMGSRCAVNPSYPDRWMMGSPGTADPSYLG